jgi:HAD superfamily hydrolase (TIGR01509 family)
MRRYEIARDPVNLWALKSRRYMALVEHDLQPMPGALELLGRLHRHVPLALASSSWRRNVEAVLGKLGVIELFDVIATGESTPRVKPHPDIFLYTSDRLGLPPSGCVVLEDAEKGVLAATAAGMASVAVPTPYTQAHDFSSASLVVRSLEDVTLETLQRLVLERRQTG